MRSHVKMVNAVNGGKGDYAVSMNFLDETNWCPSSECLEDDFICPLPTKGSNDCAGDFCSAQLPLSDFSNRDLEKIRFEGAELSCSNFSKAKLSGSNFSNTDLCQTSFVNADLRLSNFDGADLSFADLRYADLRGANLQNIRFHNVDWKGAKFDRNTKLPVDRDEAEKQGMIYCF